MVLTPGSSARSGAPRRLEFAGDKLSLGRGEKCNLVLDDEEISRLHATINYRESGFEIRDVGSANGTYLNGAPIIEAEIRDGDLLEMGSFIIAAHIINQSLHLDIAQKTATDRATPTSASGAKSSERPQSSSASPGSPVTVKKLKESRVHSQTTSPNVKRRARYPIIAGLALTLVVALLLVFAGRTYASDRALVLTPRKARFTLPSVPSTRLPLSGAQTPTQD